MRKHKMDKIKKTISGTILTLIICMAMIVIGLHAQIASVKADDVPPPTLMVVPGEVEAYPGEIFNVNVTINDLAAEWDLAGWEVVLHYDTRLLDVQNVTEGPFLKEFEGSDGTYFITRYDGDYYPPYTDKTYDDFGKVLAACAFINGHDTPNGSGTLATITFEWDATEWTTELLAGCDLTFQEVKLSDGNASLIPYTAFFGHFKPKTGPVLMAVPCEVEAYPGETFDVDITINDLAAEWDLFGWEFQLWYDTDVLDVVNVVEGSFMESFAGPDGTYFIAKFGGDYYPPDSTYDAEGVALAACTFVDGHNTAHGSGTLATITFQWDATEWSVEQLACCDLVIEAKLADGNANPIPFTTIDGQFCPREGPVLKVVPSEVIVAPGETFDVDITINDLAAEWDLFGWEFQLWYDTDVLDVVNVVEGSFMESFAGPDGTYFIAKFGGDYYPPQGTYDDFGVVLVACAFKDGYTPPEGTGTLATITFKFNVIGGSALNFEIPGWPFPAKLSDSETNPIPCTAIHSAVPEMPVLTVVSSEVTVTLGQTFGVDVTINDLRVEWDLAGFEFQLWYNTTVLDVVNVTEGPFMRGFAGPDGTYFIARYDGDWLGPRPDWTYEDAGLVLVACAFIGEHTTPEGTGTLATITFTATEIGDIALKFEVPEWPYPAKLSNRTAGRIPCTAVDGYVHVIPDLNDDGIVDIFDGVLIIIAYDTKPGDPKWNPRADLNRDNIVDIYDLIIWSSHYGETVP